MSAFPKVIRSLVPFALGVIALLFASLDQIRSGGSFGASLYWGVAWIILTCAVTVAALIRPKLSGSLGTTFICLIGLIAALYPLAFIVSQDPIPVDEITLRRLLPSVMLIFLCWLALQFLSFEKSHLASQRLFWRFSSPAGRLLMLSLLLTILFYAVVARSIEAAKDTDSTSAMQSALNLFVGTNILYFIIVAISIWGAILAITLAIRAFGSDIDLSDKVFRDGFSSAIQSDRRLLGMLVAVLPLLGFLGTVVGISAAMAGLEITLDGSSYEASDIQSLLRESLGGLSLAFETTILGIASSAFLLIIGSFIDKGLSAPALPQE